MVSSSKQPSGHHGSSNILPRSVHTVARGHQLHTFLHVVHTMSEEKQVNGLRTAVRYGKLTKEEAAIEYQNKVRESGLSSPAFEKWLARR